MWKKKDCCTYVQSLKEKGDYLVLNKQKVKTPSKFEMAKFPYDMGKFAISTFTWPKKMGSGYLQRINKEHERRLLQAKDIINYPQFKTWGKLRWSIFSEVMTFLFIFSIIQQQCNEQALEWQQRFLDWIWVWLNTQWLIYYTASIYLA